MIGRRNPIYPLHAAGWSRERAQGYLYGLLGVWWPKSCCRQCFMWNLSWLGSQVMITVRWDHFPLVEQHHEARRWLQFTANLGRASNTVDAYGRAVEDHLAFCLLVGADPATARPDVIAAWIGDMLQRPNPRGSSTGLANATIQQRISVTWNLTAADTISLLYDHELRRCVGHRSADGEVAGARPARAGRSLAAGVG